MRGLVKAGWVMGLAWSALSILGVLLASPAPDDQTLIYAFTAIAVVAGIGASVLLRQGRTRAGGGALLLAGLCAPTWGLALLNLVPIVVGGLLVARSAPAPTT